MKRQPKKKRKKSPFRNFVLTSCEIGSLKSKKDPGFKNKLKHNRCKRKDQVKKDLNDVIKN